MACTNCASCGCNQCVEINWSTTPVATTLNPCVIPEPCADGCVDTIKSDCVILSKNVSCELDLYIIAGATLTNAFKALYCPELFDFEVDSIVDACLDVNNGYSGIINLNITPSTYTIKLYKNNVLISTITETDTSFIDLVAGNYVLVLNNTTALNVTVPSVESCA